jgi:hypothetical protein
MFGNVYKPLGLAALWFDASPRESVDAVFVGIRHDGKILDLRRHPTVIDVNYLASDRMAAIFLIQMRSEIYDRQEQKSICPFLRTYTDIGYWRPSTVLPNLPGKLGQAAAHLWTDIAGSHDVLCTEGFLAIKRRPRLKETSSLWFHHGYEMYER